MGSHGFASFPAWLRITHFLNLLFMTLLIRSGLEVLSAHPKLYWRDDCLPGREWLKFTHKEMPKDKLWTSKDEEEPFPSWLALPGRSHLGLGRHWHYLSVMGWVLTGVTYVVLLFATGEWRRLIPTSWSVFPEAWHTLLTYLSFHMPPETGHYNALQQLSYAGVVFLLGPLLILTGAAMSPALSARFPWYPRLFGGRQAARSLHFLGLGLFSLFILVHVVMVALHGLGKNLGKIVLGSEQASHLWASVIAAVALGAVVALHVWATRASLAHPTRTQRRLGRVVDPVRGALFHRLTSRQHLTREDISPYFRVNGRPPTTPEYERLKAEHFVSWRLHVGGLVRTPVTLSLDDLLRMRQARQVTLHNCIQGWSAAAEWTGVPLSELLDLCQPLPNARYIVFYSYPQEEYEGTYYGSIDMELAHHPQTLLAYEMNGQPLPVEHGAPLRLRLETELGFKMVKYIHSIELVESVEHLGRGLGGYREDHQQYGTGAEI